jgi:hypothetical protein
VARKASARRSQSRGRPRIDDKAYRVPFSPSGVTEGPCGICLPASGGVVKWDGERFAAQLAQRSARASGLPSRLGSKQRRKIGLDFGGQIFEQLRARASKPEERSQLPQRCHPGFCDDGAPAQEGVLSLRREIVRAEQRFGKSTLHFVLQQGRRLPSDRPCQRRVGRIAKPGANRHEVRGAHDRGRTKRERGKTSEESTPRNNMRAHPSYPGRSLINYTRQLHSADALADEGRMGFRSSYVFHPNLAAPPGVGDIPNRGSSQNQAQPAVSFLAAPRPDSRRSKAAEDGDEALTS